MYQNYRIGAVLLLGGEGRRFQDPTPKQFHPIGEMQVYQIALKTIAESGWFDEIIVVCHPAWISAIDLTSIPRKETVRVVPGGKTRQASSFAGISALSKNVQITLIHDGVRPFVSQIILQDNLDAAIAFQAVDTCIPSTDTLIMSLDQKMICEIPNRSSFFRGQTPQTFCSRLILKAHDHALRQGITNASDDCQLVLALPHPVAIVLGNDMNLKITSHIDLLTAEALCSLQPNN